MFICYKIISVVFFLNDLHFYKTFSMQENFDNILDMVTLHRKTEGVLVNDKYIYSLFNQIDDRVVNMKIVFPTYFENQADISRITSDVANAKSINDYIIGSAMFLIFNGYNDNMELIWYKSNSTYIRSLVVLLFYLKFEDVDIDHFPRFKDYAFIFNKKERMRRTYEVNMIENCIKTLRNKNKIFLREKIKIWNEISKKRS